MLAGRLTLHVVQARVKIEGTIPGIKEAQCRARNGRALRALQRRVGVVHAVRSRPQILSQ